MSHIWQATLLRSHGGRKADGGGVKGTFDARFLSWPACALAEVVDLGGEQSTTLFDRRRFWGERQWKINGRQ